MTGFDPKVYAREAQEQQQARPNGAAPDAEPPLPLVMLDDCELDRDVFWAIEDVIPRCNMMMIFGRGGCGKTYLLTSVSIGIASGQWFSHAAEPGGVLYCAFERPEDAEDRFAALRDRFGYRGLPFAMLKLGGQRLDGPLAERIIAASKELAVTCGLPTRAIVMDTTAAALGGAREDDEGFGRLRIIGELIHAATGALIVWVHHEGKTEGMGPRGHTTLADGCLVRWQVEEREDGSRTVFVEKANRGPCYVHLFAFKLAPFVAGKDVRGKPIELCEVQLTDLTAALESKVRARNGAAQARETDPDAGLGDRQRLVLRLLYRLHRQNPDGVPRDMLRSHFISDLAAEREQKGEPPLSRDDAAAAFRKTFQRLRHRIEERDGHLAPIDR